MKLRLNYAVATICCLVIGSGVAQADTFDLDCVVNGNPIIGNFDTNAEEQSAFGMNIDSLSVSVERVVIFNKKEGTLVVS